VADDPFAAANAIIVLNDLEERSHPPEARLAAYVGGGESVEAAANTLGISGHTARGVLKKIMHKTDAHRQVELVALVARILAPASTGQPPS